MTKNSLFAAFLFTLPGMTSGQTVVTSATAPETDIVASSPIGGIDTALFDEDANANHSRGQLFTLPDAGGSQFEVSAITIRKSTNQTYLNDVLTLRIFEGTEEQWATGTGHETAIDGDDYLVDTTVTLLHTEAFTLNSAFANNDYVTFQLATPILLNGNSDFGFFMTYDQVDGTEDRFRHRENGTGGGRLSVTTAAHGATGETSRRVVFFVQGLVIDTGITDPTIAASEALVEVGNPVEISVSFDTTADTAVLATSVGAVDLISLDASDATPGDGLVVVSDSPTSTFSYEVVVTKAGEVDEDASVQVLVADPATEATDNAFSSAIKGDSPLFYYRFEDDPAAGFLLDSSGNGHHTAEINGSLGLGVGPGGMQNAGEVSNVGILVPATSDMSASFTATAVVNVDVYQSAAVQGLFSMTDGNLTGRTIFYPNAGQLRSFIDGTTLTSPGGEVPPNETSCLLHFIYDADPDADPATDDQELRFYINGDLQGGGGVSPTNPVAANIGNWVIGSNKVRTSQFIQGWIDETAVFEEALSDAQIAAHASAFFAAADPLLGLTADVLTVDFGNPVTFTWKISDQATAVTVNGTPQAIDGGGIYTNSYTPAADTTYTLEVTGPGGPFTESFDVLVEGAPEIAPQITSISLDGASPPNITLQIQGPPNVSYFIKGSTNLNDGFPVEMAAGVLTDAAGAASVTFQNQNPIRFFRADISN